MLNGRVTLVVFSVTLLAVWAGRWSPSQAAEEPLRYDWQVGQAFAYEAKVVVDLPDSVETYQGTIRYTVNSVEQDRRQVTYSGGLPKSTKAKTTGQSGFRPRFGPRGRPPGPSFSPFTRSTFRGSEQTTNRITLTATGAVVALQGDSHLPYLLGNVSLLPFETLPDEDQQQWEVTTGASIREREERQSIRPWMGPFDPFGRGERDESVQAASESVKYEITENQDPVVTVAKSYELKSPAPKEGESGFVLSGTGTWKFYRRQNVPESLRMDLNLVADRGNQQVTVPITIEYRRLTEEELAEIQAAREAKLAEARQRLDEKKHEAAEAKRLAGLPLTEDEKAAALAALDGDDLATLTETLNELAQKELQESDPEIVEAITRLLSHAERPIREAAHQALLACSPEYRPRGELDRRYKGMGSVESTARTVDADTPLYVGQIVQLQERGRWLPADILELHGDGRVQVHRRGWTTSAWDKTVTRDLIQLAPEQLFQPYWIPAEAVEDDLRQWADATGSHKIEAVYLGTAEGLVHLRRKDGREIQVPIQSLSQTDQQYVQEKQKSAQLPPNPFD